jgi:hypothetical protein
MFKNSVKNLWKKIQLKKVLKNKFFGLPELPELHLKTSNTHNFWSVGPKNAIFVLPRSLFQGASSQKVSKNPKIYCIYSKMSKNENSRFGSLRTLGVKNIKRSIFQEGRKKKCLGTYFQS